MNTRYKGFDVVEEGFLKEYETYGTLLRHKKTGLEIYHLFTEHDRESLFAYTFATPSTDSTGVAHILEHSVFSGSQQFPQRDPFIEIIKNSVSSYLNAFTSIDHTTYPAASPLKKDFFSLFKVYTDAIFFPLLSKETFMQEGIRVEFDESGELRFDGVVYNEMLGANSSQERIVMKESIFSLFPNSCYSHNSGGEPVEIPQLTWEKLKDFHAKWYRPDNCKLLVYGNISLDEILGAVETNLLSRIPDFIGSDQVGRQVQEILSAGDRVTEPKTLYKSAPLDEGSSESSKSTIVVNWAITPIEDCESTMILNILTEYLLGHPGAPLYRKIRESGLGSDLSGVSGMDPDGRELVFTVGVEGSDPTHIEEFEKLLFDELKSMVQNGLDPLVLDGAIRKCEFHQKERKGGIPQGLRMQFRAIRGWLRGLSPTHTLLIEENSQQVIQSIHNTPRYMERWIEKYLIENRSRTTLVVTPSKEHSQSIEQQIQEKLQQIKSALTPELKESLKQEQDAFYQAIQDSHSDEPLAIDMLTKEDIDEPLSDPLQTSYTTNGVQIEYQEIPSQDIVYLSMYSNIAHLTVEELQFLPLFIRLFTTVPLPGKGYEEVSQQLAHLTGSCYSSCILRSVGTGESCRGYWYLRTKLLEADLEESLALFRDLLTKGEVNNRSRIRLVIQEIIQELVTDIVPSGHSFGLKRASSSLSLSLGWDERWDGVTLLETLQAIPLDDDQEIDKLGEIFLKTLKKISVPSKYFVSVGSDYQEGVVSQLIGFSEALGKPEKDTPFEVEPFTEEYPLHDHFSKIDGHSVSYETLTIPGQSSYSSLVVPSCGYSDLGASLTVLGHILSFGHLWKSVRIEGGAYGVGAMQQNSDRIFSFYSYRDPNPLQSVETFLQSGAIAQQVDQETLDATIIRILGSLLKPKVPSEQNSAGATRWVFDITRDQREREITAIRNVTIESVIEAGKFLETQLPLAQVSLCTNQRYVEDHSELKNTIHQLSL